MELRHLRYFMTVAAERNFTRAAAVLNVAQPPLSRQIRELEAELGVTLFDRDSRPVRLTEAGRLFHEQAANILSSFEQLRAVMRRFSSSGKRPFIIGFVGSTIYGPIPRLIRQFRAMAPHVEVRLIELMTLDQIGALKDGRIDVGIGRLRIEDSAIRREVLDLEPLVVAAPLGHKLAARKGPVPLAALDKEVVIVYPSQPRPSYADQVLSLFRDHGLNPPQIQEVRELQTALGLVAAQAGICLVPASVRRLRRDDVVYCDLAEQDAVSPVIVSWRAQDTSAEIRQFMDISGKLYKTHP